MVRKLGTVGTSLFCVMLTFAVAGCPQSGSGSQTPGSVFDLSLLTRGRAVQQYTDGSYFISATAWYANEKDLRGLWAILDESFRLQAVSPGSSPFAVEESSEPVLARVLGDGRVIETGVTVGLLEVGDEIARLRIVLRDDSLNPVWDVEYGDSLWAPFDLAQTEASSILVLVQIRGYSVVTGNAVLNIRLSDGEVLHRWDLPSDFRSAYRLTALSDGGWVVCGRGDWDNGSNLDTIIVRYDNAGNVLWSKAFAVDPLSRDTGRGIVEAENGDLVLAITGSHVSGVLRVSPDGAVVWLASDFLLPDSGNESDEVWDVAITPGGMIAVIGTERRVDYIAQTIPVVRESSFVALLDSEGNRIWKTNVSGTNFFGVTYTLQNTLVVTGTTSGGDLHVVEVDMDGDVL